MAQLWAPLLLVLTGLAGCARPFAPLSPYNDAWTGVLSVRGQELAVRMEIFITRADQRGEREPPHSKRCFAELSLEEVGPLSVVGQVSHYDFGQLEKEVHSPQPRREFLELRLQHVGAIAPSGDSAEARRSCREAHERLMERLGEDVGGSLGEVTLYGERLPDAQIRGVAVLNRSSTGACAHKAGGGRCRQWHVNSARARIGTFTLRRTGRPAAGEHVDDETVISRAFVFRRRRQGPGQVSWWVELRRRPVPRGDEQPGAATSRKPGGEGENREDGQETHSSDPRSRTHGR